MKTFRLLGLTFLLVLAAGVQATVITGTISGWNESAEVRSIGDGSNHVSLWWSINSIEPVVRGWFYGSIFTGDSDIAFATGVTNINQIVDASTLSFTNDHIIAGYESGVAVGNGLGDYLVWKNKSSGYYGVLRADNIYRVDPNNLEITFNTALNGTWWFQTDGTGNFSTVPEPSTIVLGLGCLGSMRRRKRSV